MENKELNEDCGCGGSSSSPSQEAPRPYMGETDPNIGKAATLWDGRNATINDSIRNSRGEVIGYVMNGERGAFRVFKERVTKIYEDGAMASLATVSGMGEVSPPTSTSVGSGDQFPSLSVGTPAAKKKKKLKKEKKSEKSIGNSVMSWKDFHKNAIKNQ